MTNNNKLTKTQENCVDRHGVDAEKQAGNEVSAQHGGDNRDHVVIGRRQILIDVVNAVSEDIEGDNADRGDNDETADKQQEIRHLVQHGDSCNITKQKRESLRSRFAETRSIDSAHNVGVTVNKSHELLQNPENRFQITLDDSITNN